MATRVLTGDTIRVKVAFKNENDVLIDPDGDATFKVFDAETKKELASLLMTLESTGKFYVDWTIPTVEKDYILQVSADFDTFPQMQRSMIKARFKPEA